MAQIDFPSNPQVNDTFIANGITYTWDGVKWDGTIVISSGGTGGSTFSTTVTAPELQANNTGNASVLLDLQRAGATQFSITAEPNININSACDILLNDADGQALRVMQGTDEYMRFNTSTQAIITKNALEIDGGLNIESAVDLGANVDCTINTNITVKDNSALALRVLEGGNEYVRFNTTDGEEVIDFSKNVKLDGGVDCTKDINIIQPNNGNTDINVENTKGSALRVMNLGGGELFRFNTNVSPNLADFSCAVKFDNNVETAFGTLTVSDALNVVIPAGNSNGLDIVAAGALTTFGLRFNTSAEQLITDYDFVNDNNDGVIQLGGTTAAPNLKLVGDGSATFGGAISATGNVTGALFQQANNSGSPVNTGTSHFYSDISLGFTGSFAQLDTNKHVSKFIIQRNFAGNSGGLVIKGGRPHEAANGTQNILDIHYQDVAAGDDIRYYGSTAHNNSLQNKTSVNALIDNKITSVGGVQQSQGTFTATLAGTTSNPSVSQTTTGNYIRVGQLVTVYIAFHNMAATGGAGTVQITGLPFNIENLSSGSGGQFTEPVGSVWFDKDVLFDTQRTVIPFGPANTTTIQFVAQGVQGYLPYTGSPGSGMRLEVQLSYITDAS